MILVRELHGEKVVPVRAVPLLTCSFIDCGLVADMLVQPETSVGHLGYMARAFMSDPKLGHVLLAPQNLHRHLAHTPMLDRNARANLDEQEALRFLPAGVYFRVSELQPVFNALVQEEQAQHDQRHGWNAGDRYSGVEGVSWSEAVLLDPSYAEIIFEGFDPEIDRAVVVDATSESSEEVELVRDSVMRLQEMFSTVGGAELPLDPLGIGMKNMLEFVRDLSRRGTRELSDRAIRRALAALDISGVRGQKAMASSVQSARIKVEEHLKQQGMRRS